MGKKTEQMNGNWDYTVSLRGIRASRFPCLFGGPLSVHSKGYCLYHSGFLMFLILELRFCDQGVKGY